MDENPVSAEKIRAFVDGRLKRAKRNERILLWVLHLFAFLFFFLGSQPMNSTAIFFAIGWMIGLFIHACAVWMESGAGERYLRRLLAGQAVKELYAEAATSAALSEPEKEKAKRDQMVALSDDGELIPIEEVADDADAGMLRRSGPG
jgi:hypothetical protein